MIRELEENLQDVTEACRRFGVVRLYVFGLLEELRSLLGNVDLVVVGAVKNPYMARAIDQEKQLLYTA